MITDLLTDGNLFRLMAWLSPSFPVGGYVFSHAIEYAVEDGRIEDQESLTEWLAAYLRHGAGKIDGALFCAAWRAATDNDEDALTRARERADAMRATSEQALESSAQGQAFMETVGKTWDSDAFDIWALKLQSPDRLISYCIAVAIAAAVAGIPLRPALVAYTHATIANLVSAGVRLIPLGQIAGQRTIEGLQIKIIEAVDQALAQSIDDLGTAAPLIDIMSMKHETQYTRLFRS